MSAFGNCPATHPAQRTGKVFMVNQGIRTCLVRGQEFSRQAAAELDSVACYLAEFDERSQNANR